MMDEMPPAMWKWVGNVLEEPLGKSPIDMSSEVIIGIEDGILEMTVM